MRAVKGQRSKVKGWTLPNPPIKGRESRVLRRLAMSGAWLRVKGSWFLLTAIMLMSLGLFSSCEYKELCYDHHHDKDYTAMLVLKLQLDVDVEIEMESKIEPPEYMKVCFYSPETQGLQSTEFVGTYGGPLHTAPGSYDMLVYSFGTEYIQIRGESDINTIEAFTSDITPLKMRILASFAQDQDDDYEAPGPIIFPPDHLLVARETVKIPTREEAGDGVITIEATASTIVETYDFVVTNIEGAQYIESVEAFVTNQAVSSFFGRREVNPSPATLCFPVEVYPAEGMLMTAFNTFGKLPGESVCYLHILIRDTGGKEYRFTRDITDQFLRPDHVIEISDEIIIPQPEGGGSGIAPTVDEWEEVNQNVPIG